MFKYLLYICFFLSIKCWPNFELYTKSNNENYVIINSQNLTNSGFSNAKDTKFLVHGFSGGSSSLISIKNELLKFYDVNVIVVEWGEGARPPNYFSAAANTKKVGEKMADFINEAGLDGSKIHCIGHSLGAHICGFASKIKRIARISGMDPAGPLFVREPVDSRLDKSDADFVDVIHTDSELGIQKPIGHLDFYPNGGKKQNGCILRANDLINAKGNEEKFKVIQVRIEAKGDVGGFLSCSHSKSHQLYAESISMCHFKAVKCSNYVDFLKKVCSCEKNCVQMGYNAKKSDSEGKYFLKTGDSSPHC
ncbi:pancreatic triacylglycerol lipase [Brachionus plicatilis]|uniref:Pancreatic triacylglycerol lipase n=1 Tax=Brachionus plicatilis TaxID=10195 RepID=A0A3M7RGG4_BRAPC|nr:pancreatic triacylglycerol lipase [Brachionus plicatilis]